MDNETIKRLDNKLKEIKALYDEGKDTGLSAFGCGILAGINQALLWILEPDNWIEPLSTIPGLRSVSDTSENRKQEEEIQ